MSFRRKLIDTLRAVQPVLGVPGVLVVGSEVPNLLQPDVASTLVVSQDVDLAVPVGQLAEVKQQLEHVRALRPSSEEPSVWVSESGDLLEVNFVGLDPGRGDIGETYVRDDDVLPLMVFGPLGLLRPGQVLEVEGLRVPLPTPATLLMEKLVTERSGIKGDRDLLVALGLLMLAHSDELEEAHRLLRSLSKEHRHAARSNLSVLSLLQPLARMPDPVSHRELVRRFLLKLEEGEEDLP